MKILCLHKNGSIKELKWIAKFIDRLIHIRIRCEKILSVLIFESCDR